MRSSQNRVTLVGGIGALLLAITAPSQTPSATPADDTAAIAEGNRKFAFSLFHAIVREAPAGNVLISPYSISAALAMTAAGAAGQTEQQMLDTLQLKVGSEVHRQRRQETPGLPEQVRQNVLRCHEQEDGQPVPALLHRNGMSRNPAILRGTRGMAYPC